MINIEPSLLCYRLSDISLKNYEENFMGFEEDGLNQTHLCGLALAAKPHYNARALKWNACSGRN
jgi:hypothetical protein